MAGKSNFILQIPKVSHSHSFSHWILHTHTHIVPSISAWWSLVTRITCVQCFGTRDIGCHGSQSHSVVTRDWSEICHWCPLAVGAVWDLLHHCFISPFIVLSKIPSFHSTLVFPTAHLKFCSPSSLHLILGNFPSLNSFGLKSHILIMSPL